MTFVVRVSAGKGANRAMDFVVRRIKRIAEERGRSMLAQFSRTNTLENSTRGSCTCAPDMEHGRPSAATRRAGRSGLVADYNTRVGLSRCVGLQ